MSINKHFTIPENKFISIAQAADLHEVTQQAIYVAIKLNKLKASKNNTHWTIHLDDLEAYSKEKYSRSKSMFNGELVYDPTQGRYSINQVSKILNVPVQKIYYATRIGQLKAHRKGVAWVIHENDMKVYAEELVAKRKKRKVS